MSRCIRLCALSRLTAKAPQLMRTRGISTGLPAQDSAPNTGGPAAPDAVEPPWSGPDVRLPSSGQAYNPATSGGLRPYLVIALDKQVPEALEKRLKVRDAHLAEARAGKEAGRVLVGGGVLGALDFPPVEAPAQETANQLAGSALVVIAESAAEVMARVKRDVYYRSGVWDPENTTIMPFAMQMAPTPSAQLTQGEKHAGDAEA